MSKLQALAGRPGEGKAAYLQKTKAQYGAAIQLVSAADYISHEELMKSLYDVVQDDNYKCVIIDDYEVSLIKNWNNHVDDEDYQKKLSTLAGFSDVFDISIIVVVGLRREADVKENNYSDKTFLRSSVLNEEIDEVFFYKGWIIKQISTMICNMHYGKAYYSIIVNI